MKKTVLYPAWAALYVLCTVLGGIPGAQGAWQILGYLFSAVFFVPGFLLLWDGRKRSDRKQLRIVFCIAAASLALTLVFLICNLLSATASQSVGDALHVVLMLVSTPMLCAPSWVFSLFFWSFLLIGAIPGWKK